MEREGRRKDSGVRPVVAIIIHKAGLRVKPIKSRMTNVIEPIGIGIRGVVEKFSGKIIHILGKKLRKKGRGAERKKYRAGILTLMGTSWPGGLLCLAIAALCEPFDTSLSLDTTSAQRLSLRQHRRLDFLDSTRANGRADL